MTEQTTTPTDPTRGTPLVIAAHGTRHEDGVAACRALVERVSRRIAGTPVEVGFVELAEPSIAQAVAAAVAQADQDPAAVVVPLLLHTGGHVRCDIPEAIDEGRGDAEVLYSSPLLPDVRLRRALGQRLATALGEGQPWRSRDVGCVLVGRGAVVPEANAAHYQLTRLFWEENELGRVEPAFIQVCRPSLPEALNSLAAQGFRQIVVVGNFLFPGKLQQWQAEQTQAWVESRPDVEVRIADVIGDCDELADVVIDRYREPLGEVGFGDGAPVYLSGLRLQGRPVLVVGAGRVAERRIVRLLEAGAQVRVVAPNAGIRVAKMAAKGLVTWQQRAFAEADVDGAWYVQALTNDPQVNARVAEAAAAQRIFCVRSDRADQGTAFTPATEQAGGLTVSVVGDRSPRRSARLRDHLLEALQG